MKDHRSAMLKKSCFGGIHSSTSFRVFFPLLCISSAILYCTINIVEFGGHARSYDFSTSQNVPCKQQVLDPWDQNLKPFLKEVSLAPCPETCNLFYVDRKGFLQLNSKCSFLYNMTSLKCVYHVLNRVGDYNLTIGESVQFKPPEFVESHVFCVVCTNTAGAILYRFVHSNLMWNASAKRENEIGRESDEKLSVIILGLDSVSRSHAVRYLPMTYEYLTQTLGSVDLHGYRKVGLNSFPNIVPLLTGESSDAFESQSRNLAYMDGMPFIWKYAISRNYVTHFSEDFSFYTTFNYNKMGFNRTPVDYYYQPLSLAMEAAAPRIKTKRTANHASGCYGDKDKFQLQIDYLKRFMDKYSERLSFAFFWHNAVSHNEFHTLGRADRPLLGLLQWLKSAGHLDRSILLVGSDHGFRLGGASITRVGRRENNMPFMAVYVPPALLSRDEWIRENLLQNADALVTPYDIYETMKTVMSGDFSHSVYPDVQRFLVRRNLFERIPSLRTCADAGIPERFCACVETVPVPVSSPIVTVLANYSVTLINNKLKGYTKLCRRLELHRVTDAQRIPIKKESKPDGAFNFKSLHLFTAWRNSGEHDGRYVLLFRTKPNAAIYEIMMDYQYMGNVPIDLSTKVIGNPSRLDFFGSDSACVHGEFIKQYCSCF